MPDSSPARRHCMPPNVNIQVTPSRRRRSTRSGLRPRRRTPVRSRSRATSSASAAVMKTSISASASHDDEALVRGFSTLGEETISNKFGRLLSAHPPYGGSALPEHPSRRAHIQPLHSHPRLICVQLLSLELRYGRQKADDQRSQLRGKEIFKVGQLRTNHHAAIDSQFAAKRNPTESICRACQPRTGATGFLRTLASPTMSGPTRRVPRWTHSAASSG